MKVSGDAFMGDASADVVHACNRLLILEDERLYGEQIIYRAQKLGISTRLVASVEEFREIYSQYQPTMILLDLMLNAGDVSPVIEWLAKRHCTAPVFFLSGYPQWVLDTAAEIGRSHGLLIAGTAEKPRDGLTRIMHKIESYIIR